MSHIKVTLKRSVIGHPQSIRRVVWALGLRRRQQSNTLKDNNCIRGMVNKVIHLVDYQLVDGPGK